VKGRGLIQPFEAKGCLFWTLKRSTNHDLP
jgi:hypothetical protein